MRISMDLKLISQLFSLRDLRNAAVAAIVIIGGIGRDKSLLSAFVVTEKPILNS